MNRYLEDLSVLFGIFGENNQDRQPLEAQTYGGLKRQLKGYGIEIGEYGELGDGIWCVWDGGELKITAYISTRGGAYQAGAYDGGIGYYITNMELKVPEEGHAPPNKWVSEGTSPASVCAHIAEEAWISIQTRPKLIKDMWEAYVEASDDTSFKNAIKDLGPTKDDYRGMEAALAVVEEWNYGEEE